ncbi:MAG: L,D-transpeptidase family protein [Muribaculaceae bacterium]|nr:L,D-transpeptidase family protein [Muribaculaceae bacterium]
MSIFARLLLGVTVLCASGCSGRNSGDSDGENAEFSTVMPDTFAIDSPDDSGNEGVDTVVKNTRHTTKEEIIAYIAESPHKAEYEAGIIPTMAEYVPQYASKLLDNETDGFLIVDKNTMKLYRYDKFGRELEHVGIACSKKYGSKHKKADNRTPEGFFTIEGIYDSTDWLYTDDDGNTSPVKGQFGPRYMRLRTPVTSQVGIHGTSAPWSIGGRRSHGCIRMTNENILRIHKLCQAGMPVIVSPGPRDMAVNEEEGYDIPSVPVRKGGVPCKPGKYSERDQDKNTSKETPVTSPDTVTEIPVHPQPSVAEPVPASVDTFDRHPETAPESVTTPHGSSVTE